LAFAGSAEVDYENVKTLLNDLIGVTGEDSDGFPIIEPEDREINLIFPANTESAAVEAALDWSEYVDLEYTAVTEKGGKNNGAITKDATDTLEVGNVSAQIAELLAAAEGDKYLIIAFGDDEEDEVLLDLVLNADVPAKDLSDGLDDITFNDDDAEPEKDEEPEPEPEPDEEKPKRGRRSRAAEEQKPAEEELTEEDVAPAPAEEKPKRTRRTKAQIEADRAAAEEKPDEAQALIAPDHLRVDGTKQGFNAAGNPVSGSILVDLANRHGFHPATDETKPRHEQVRQLCFELSVKLTELVPPGRELSTVLTKIEEAGFWANAGIARHLAPLENAEPAQDGAESDAEPSEGRKSRGRPRKDGTPAQPRSEEDKARTLVEDEETGEFKPRGRGRPRAGQRTRKDV
jgi:hypothetical protein